MPDGSRCHRLGTSFSASAMVVEGCRLPESATLPLRAGSQTNAEAGKGVFLPKGGTIAQQFSSPQVGCSHDMRCHGRTAGSTWTRRAKQCDRAIFWPRCKRFAIARKSGKPHKWISRKGGLETTAPRQWRRNRNSDIKKCPPRRAKGKPETVESSEWNVAVVRRGSRFGLLLLGRFTRQRRRGHELVGRLQGQN